MSPCFPLVSLHSAKKFSNFRNRICRVFIGRNLVNTSALHLVRDHPPPAAGLHSLRRLLLHETVQIKDDVTMVLIKRYELPISHDSIRTLRQFISEEAGRAGLAEEETDMLVLASVEVFTNIVRHGQGLLTSAPLELVTEITPHEFVVELIHLGDEFTPPAEPMESNFAEFPEGGFGLTIIQKACDRVDYLHHGGVTTVRLVRYLTS